MAKSPRKHKRARRSSEQQIADLEDRIAVLQGRIRNRKKFSPDWVIEDRDRLELSAADYGELVGVTALTIYNWEKGRSSPRPAELERWLGVRGMGKRKAWNQLGI